MPKVSVIIPVYNKEEYLRECLDSVVGQTLTDIEVLCIEDCSTDSSLQILREYTQRDSRVKVFQNPENKGLSYTRNVGMNHACGEYVQFVDADDQIETDTLELLYQIATENRLDLLKFMTNRQKENLLSATVSDNVFLSGQEMLIQIVCQPFCCTSACVLFLDRRFIKEKHVQFVPQMRYAEDTLFTYQAISLAQRCMCINERKYKINRVRKNSLTTEPLTDEKIFWYLFLIQNILESDYANPDSPSYRQTKFAYLVWSYLAAVAELARRLEEPDMSGWEPEIQRMYQIFFSGRGWLETLVDRKKLSMHRKAIQNADRIYIFGAGAAARRLIQILDSADVEIDGIIVSDTTQNRKRVYGYQVLSVDEISPEGQPLILSAVKGTHEEIGALLKEHGFCNILNVCP